LFPILVVICAGAASSAEFRAVASKEGKDVIYLTDYIAPGDTERFLAIIRRSNQNNRLISGVRLNSLGGNLGEGLPLALAIKNANIATIITNGTSCASACFLAFAAGSEKFASYSAKIGVHGAADQQGEETVDAAAATVSMARAARELGVPPVILGKMVTTPPLKSFDSHLQNCARWEQQ
jgi:hypothetical protein